MADFGLAAKRVALAQIWKLVRGWPQTFVTEEVVAALREAPPRLHLHAVGSHELLIGLALEERVRLVLVDRQGHLVVFDEVDAPIDVEVGDTDRPGEPSAYSCSIARQKL